MMIKSQFGKQQNQQVLQVTKKYSFLTRPKRKEHNPQADYKYKRTKKKS